MNEIDRVALLKEVAGVVAYDIAPRWSSPSVVPLQLAISSHRHDLNWLCLDNDEDDANAIIAMLDAIQEIGRVHLSSPTKDSPNTYQVRVQRNGSHFDYVGETRAEAVARAFVETFESRVVEDGHGGAWVKCDRADCDLHVVRPGKAQCSCEDV